MRLLHRPVVAHRCFVSLSPVFILKQNEVGENVHAQRRPFVHDSYQVSSLAACTAGAADKQS